MPAIGVRLRTARPGRARRAAVIVGMLAVPLAASGMTAVPAAAGTTYTVTATVGVGSAPVAVGVDPSTHTAYVASGQGSSVSVIDEATNTVTATITATGASGIGASAKAGKAGGVPHLTLTTTQPGSWVFGVGEDYSHAIAPTLGAGQALISQWVDPGPGETFWVQDQTAPAPLAGTAATINDTAPKGDIWNLAAAEILPAAS